MNVSTVCLLLQLKSRSKRSAPYHPAFNGNCPTISHTILALFTPWMSSSSSEQKRGISPKFHLIVLCLVWIKRIWKQEEFKILLYNHNGGNFLRQSPIENPDEHQLRSSPANISNYLKPYQSLLALQL